jgi:protein gp37
MRRHRSKKGDLTVNRTKIEWADWTWNPITGCKHGCWYCYAKRGYERFHRTFEPTFHPERIRELAQLNPPSGRARKPWIAKAYPAQWLVFVCSVADLFASWTLEKWRAEVLERISWTPEYVICQLLTKSPEGITNESTFNKNIWLGVTVTSQNDTSLIRTLLDVPSEGRFFGCFEPLLGKIDLPKNLPRPLDWIIVGKLTGSSFVKLQKEWVDTLIGQARSAGIPVFVKDSIVAELGEQYRIQEFPKP